MSAAPVSATNSPPPSVVTQVDTKTVMDMIKNHAPSSEINKMLKTIKADQDAEKAAGQPPSALPPEVAALMKMQEALNSIHAGKL